MIDVILIGASGHAAEITDYMIYESKKYGTNLYNIVGYLDELEATYNKYQYEKPYLGKVSEHTVSHNVQYIMAIANLTYKKPIVTQFLEKGALFATYIHPDAYISGSSQIGMGNVIAPSVNLGPMVRIGDFNLLNSRCSIGHDTLVGNFNFIAPNVCFSGGTQVGDENLFGINSATIPGIQIGNRNKIAAGMTLDKDVQNDEVVFYRFKEKIIAINKS
jgi:sugar O-acyltransferase (sialic acid O-acetyltransferase NeuD family)